MQPTSAARQDTAGSRGGLAACLTVLSFIFCACAPASRKTESDLPQSQVDPKAAAQALTPAAQLTTTDIPQSQVDSEASSQALIPAFRLNLTLNANTVVADGAHTVAASVVLTDAYNRTIVGAPITFSASNSTNDLISTTNTVTACGGKARATFASSVAGVQTITATRHVTVAKAQVNFTCAGPFLAPVAWPALPSGAVGAAMADLNFDGNVDVVTAINNGVAVLLGNGNGSFAPPVTYGTLFCYNVALTDLNGDGFLDVATTNYNDSSVTVLLGRGDGTLLAPSTFAAATSNPQGITSGDFNGDAKQDIAIGYYSGASVSLLLGNGDGTLQAATNFAVGGSGPVGIAAGDFNGDTFLDLVSANVTTTGVTVLLGVGNGTFNAGVSYTTAQGAYYVAVADLNQDGKLDLAVANYNASTASVLLGTGTGTFGAATSLGSVSGPCFLSLGDLNNDGIVDIATANLGDNSTTAFVNNGNGTFKPGVTTATCSGPRSALVQDLNNDGLGDLISGSNGNGTVAVLLGQGNGAFVATRNPTARPPSKGLTAGKGSADLKTLVFSASDNDNSISVLMSNGDGSFTSPTVYSTVIGAQLAALADLNGDNKMDAVVVGYSGSPNNLNVFFGNGNGTLQAPVLYTVPSTPYDAKAVDLNKDGFPDVITANLNASSVSVLLGSATGALGAPTNYATPALPSGLGIGDINGDTNLDIAVLSNGSNAITVLLGVGNGTFQTGVTTTSAAGQRMGLIDLNADGKADAVSANASSNTVSVLLSNGTSTLQPNAVYPVGGGPFTLAIVDVNGDTYLDVVTVNASDATLSTLYGRGNGTFQSAVSSAGIASNLGLVVQDFNSDGRPDALVSTYTNAQSLAFLANAGCQSTTYVLNANNASSYTYNSASVMLTHDAELVPLNGDNPSNAFAGGTPAGLAWDSNTAQVRLANSGGCNALTTNCAVLDPSWTPAYANLLGYWRLDGTGAAAAGSTLTAIVGPNLTVATAATNYVPGQLAQGLNLPANSNAYLTMPASFPNTAAATFMGWAQWGGGTDYQRLFDVGQDGTNSISLAVRNSSLYLGIHTAGANNDTPTQQPIKIGKWNHFLTTFDGSAAKVYVNGALQITVSTTTTPATILGATNTFGRSKYPTDPYYNGSFDELAIFNTALNANQISTIYQRQAAIYSGATVSRVFGPQSGTLPYNEFAWATTTPSYKEISSKGVSEDGKSYSGLASSNLSNGLVLTWHLNETAAGTAPGARDFRDDSGQGSHGKLYNGVTIGQPGLLQKSAYFDGGSATASDLYQYVNPQNLTISLWFNSQTQSGGKLLGFGNYVSGLSTSFDRHLYMNSVGQLYLGVISGSALTVNTTSSFNDGRWHHAVGTMSSAALSLYVDGKLAGIGAGGAAANYNGYWRLGGDNLGGWPSRPSSDFFQGYLDEASVWNRILSPSEILQLYRRGATRVKYQVRACTSASCADNPGWLGPDGTAYSYFSELNNNTNAAAATGSVLPTAADLPLGSFSPGLTVPSNGYFQYRMVQESDDTQTLCTYNGVASPCSPEVQSVTVGPTTYATANTTVSNNVGTVMHGLTDLAVTYGPSGCPGGATFILSNNGGTTWYYFNGYLWVVSNQTASQSNTPAQLTGSVMSSFIPQKGFGPITFRAFLNSSGSTPCSLASVSFSGSP
jgi:hypothetical protein